MAARNGTKGFRKPGGGKPAHARRDLLPSLIVLPVPRVLTFHHDLDAMPGKALPTPISHHKQGVVFAQEK